MNITKRTTLTVLLSGALVLGGVAPALAGIVNVGGGMWDQGLTSDRVYSNYHHADNCHSSAAYGTYNSHGLGNPGEWAYANAPRASSNNQTFWNNDVTGCRPGA